MCLLVFKLLDVLSNTYYCYQRILQSEFYKVGELSALEFSLHYHHLKSKFPNLKKKKKKKEDIGTK